MNNASTSTVKFAFIGIVAIHLIVLTSMRLYPFIDLPNHLAEATIFKYQNTDGNILQEYYSPTPWYYPNLFHTVFCSLFPTVETGNIIFHCAYVILLAWAIYLIIRELGGNLWFGLLSLLYIYNYNVTFGFVGFAFSFPIILLLFYFTLRDFRQPSLGYKIIAMTLLLLLFTIHAQAALFGALLYGVLVLYQYRNSFQRIMSHGLLVIGPLLAIILFWWANRPSEKEDSTLNYLAQYYSSTYFSDFAIRFRLVVFDHFQLMSGWNGLLLAAFFAVSLVIPILYYKPWTRAKLFSSTTALPLLFFATSLGCYLFLPDKLPGQSPLAQRFCTLVFLSFIILGSVWLNHATTKRLRGYTLSIVLLSTLLWSEYMITFNRINKEFHQSFFEGIDNSSRLAGLIYDNDYRGRKAYIHFPNYYLVWHHGITASKIIDFRFGVVRRVASEEIIPFYEDLIGEEYSVQPEYQRLEFLLARGKAPVQPDDNIQNFTLVRQRGPWYLYQNDREISQTLNHQTSIKK